jgi:hypothetical protein
MYSWSLYVEYPTFNPDVAVHIAPVPVLYNVDPYDPIGINVVTLVAAWIGILPASPPARLVAVLFSGPVGPCGPVTPCGPVGPCTP